MNPALYVVYTYETLPDGTLDCHILSGEANQASWSQTEAEAELTALKSRNANLGGMVLPIEMVDAAAG